MNPKSDRRCPEKVRNHGSAQPLQGTEVGTLLPVSDVASVKFVLGFQEFVLRCQHMYFQGSEIKLGSVPHSRPTDSPPDPHMCGHWLLECGAGHGHGHFLGLAVRFRISAPSHTCLGMFSLLRNEPEAKHPDPKTQTLRHQEPNTLSLQFAALISAAQKMNRERSNQNPQQAEHIGTSTGEARARESRKT